MEIRVLFLTFVLFFSPLALAQPRACEVPVCDIQSKIEEMKSLNSSDRAQVVKNLRLQHRAETSSVIWENLKAFAVKAESLFIDLKEEDWVIREAIYLQNVSRVALIKFAPIQRNQLIENFSGLRDEGAAFEVLNYWFLEIEKVTSAEQILDLMAFAEFAREWAIKNQQEAYVIREADKLLQAGSQRVSQLRPAHEGLYKITVRCEPEVGDCHKRTQQLTHLTIMDTLTARGLVVSFSSEKLKMLAYLFTTAELTKNGTHIRGLSTEATPYTRVAEVQVDVDPLTGTVSGTLKDEAHPGVVHFTGQPVRRITQFYTDEGPSRVISENQILGRYQGQLGKAKAELVVSRYSDGQLVGVITYKNGDIVLPFKAGDFNAERGVLSLTALGSGFQKSDRKLVLGLRKDSQGRELLKGFLLLSLPQSAEAEFYKIGDR